MHLRFYAINFRKLINIYIYIFAYLQNTEVLVESSPLLISAMLY